MEIWKDIEGFEGLYQVSDLGRVKSLSKTWIGGNGAIIIKNETILKERVTQKYNYVALCKNGLRIQKRVSILVWETFIGKPKFIIDHIVKGSQLDNRLSNLQDITYRQNNSKDREPESGFTGVRKHGRGWMARINANNKIIYLGTYDTKEKAHQVYLENCKKYGDKKPRRNIAKLN